MTLQEGLRDLVDRFEKVVELNPDPGAPALAGHLDRGSGRLRQARASAQLGHANPTTTLRHYARWMPKKGKRWANALDKIARGGRFVEPKGGASEEEG